VRKPRAPQIGTKGRGVSDAAPALDPLTLRAGLLMESVQTHQKMAEVHLDRLTKHTQGLDSIVRDEIRRTLVDELQSLTAEIQRTLQSLVAMRRAASVRGVVLQLGVTALCVLIPSAMLRWALPNPVELVSLRAQRNALGQNLASLERQGARIEWRHCGEAARLCARVERGAPTYGEKADFYVLKGY